MKKNEMKTVTENIVNEPVIVMDDETKKSIIEDNLHLVPKNQLKRFNAMTLDEQIEKMQYYQDRAVKIEQWKKTSSIAYKVKDLFERRKATVQDAKEVMKFCADFIDTFKLREIARLDEEIHRLELMKESLA